VLDKSLDFLYNIVVKLYDTQMTITTNERGEQNMFAKEPKMYITEKDMQQNEVETYAERAEKLNGRFAMMGFVAAVISYVTTGNLFFGVW